MMRRKKMEPNDDNDDTVAYDETFGEIMVNGANVYLPDDFGRNNVFDGGLLMARDEDRSPGVELFWEGVRDEYRSLTPDQALALAMSLLQAVRQRIEIGLEVSE